MRLGYSGSDVKTQKAHSKYSRVGSKGRKVSRGQSQHINFLRLGSKDMSDTFTSQTINDFKCFQVFFLRGTDNTHGKMTVIL